MSNTIHPLSTLAATPASSRKDNGSGDGSWFEAMAEAWGQTLDRQAARIEELSNQIGGGDDSPAAITNLTAESLKMGFLSNGSHSSLTAIGEGLNKMASKQ